jgi:dihydropyrimidinase
LGDHAQLCAFNPANVMGMTRKGDLAPGLDADVTIINPAESRVVGPQALRSRADWSPYTGMTLSGFAHTVILRGQPVLEAGTITARPGSGRFIPRTLPG